MVRRLGHTPRMRTSTFTLDKMKKIRERMKTWKERRQLRLTKSEKRGLKALDWLAKITRKGHEPKKWRKLTEEERERFTGVINQKREEVIAKAKARK